MVVVGLLLMCLEVEKVRYLYRKHLQKSYHHLQNRPYHQILIRLGEQSFYRYRSHPHIHHCRHPHHHRKRYWELTLAHAELEDPLVGEGERLAAP